MREYGLGRLETNVFEGAFFCRFLFCFVVHDVALTFMV